MAGAQFDQLRLEGRQSERSARLYLEMLQLQLAVTWSSLVQGSPEPEYGRSATLLSAWRAAAPTPDTVSSFTASRP